MKRTMITIYIIMVYAMAMTAGFVVSEETNDKLQKRSNDLTNFVRGLTGKLANQPSICVLWPKDLRKDAIVMPLYKRAHRENTGDNSIESIDCK